MGQGGASGGLHCAFHAFPLALGHSPARSPPARLLPARPHPAHFLPAQIHPHCWLLQPPTPPQFPGPLRLQFLPF